MTQRFVCESRGPRPPARFNPGNYRTRIHSLRGTFEVASDEFGVPPSVLAGVIGTEWTLDAKRGLDHPGEAVGFRLWCGTPLIGLTGGRASVGSGQIQIRRARLVDYDVRDAVWGASVAATGAAQAHYVGLGLQGC